MAFKFGKRSTDNMAQVDDRLKKVLHEAIKHMDFTVIVGYRDEEAQEKAFNEGKSKVHYPHGKHNKMPSLAVDIVPVFNGKEIDWNDTLAFGRLAGVVLTCAEQQGIKLRWGADWNMNYRSKDERFLDLGHFEIFE